MTDNRTEIDKDLLDHGAASSGPSMFTNEAREYPNFNAGMPGIGNKELSDMGAVSSGPTMFTGEARDLPDVDLSDHGAVPYATKEETWGTNDMDIIHEMDIIEHAAWSENVERVIPQLPAASLAQVVDKRYRQIMYILQDGRYGIGKDQKEYLGSDFSMLTRMAESIISSNPKGLEEIFTPELLLGANKKTDIFGVLEKCKKGLDEIGVAIPLLGKENAPIVDETGKAITAQDKLAALIALKPKKGMVTEVSTPVETSAPVIEEVQTPVVETPVVEMPVVETPIVETPVEPTPVVETQQQSKSISLWDRFKMKRLKSKGQGESIDETTKAM